MAKITNEDAIFCEKSYIGETNCIDCKYYGLDTCLSRESHRMAVKALEEQNSIFDILDKIRAEIVNLGQRTMNDNRASGIWACRDIIDKYKESVNKE